MARKKVEIKKTGGRGEELEQPSSPIEPTPEFNPDLTLDQIIADLKGFGVENTEGIINLRAGGKLISLKLSNIPNEAEIDALTAAEGLKGHLWVARIKCEVLSRAISWINNVDVRDSANFFATSPITGVEGQIQPILRDILMGWGQEVVNVLWKVLMKHCQGIEDRLFESLPESLIMTEVEKRFLAKALEEISEVNREVYKDAVESIIMGKD